MLSAVPRSPLVDPQSAGPPPRPVEVVPGHGEVLRRTLSRLIYLAPVMGVLTAFAFLMAPRFLAKGLPVSGPSVRVGIIDVDRPSGRAWFTSDADLLADHRYRTETGRRRMSARQIYGEAPVLAKLRSIVRQASATRFQATLVARTYVADGACARRGRRRCAAPVLRATELRAVEALRCSAETYAANGLRCPPAPPPVAPRPLQMLVASEANGFYPQDMLRAGIEGAATIAYVIDAAGRVSRCRPLGPDDHPRLGAEACRLVVENPDLVAASKPASGEKVARQRIRWALED